MEYIQRSGGYIFSIFSKKALFTTSITAILLALLSGFICESYSDPSRYLTGGPCGQPLHFNYNQNPFNQFTLVPFIIDSIFFLVILLAAYYVINKNLRDITPKIIWASILSITLSITGLVLLFFVLVIFFASVLGTLIPSAGFAGVGLVMLFSYGSIIFLGPLAYLIISPIVLNLINKNSIHLRKIISGKYLSLFPLLIMGEIIGAGIGIWVASGVVDPIFRKGIYSFSAFFLSIFLIFIPFAIKVTKTINSSIENSHEHPDSEPKKF